MASPQVRQQVLDCAWRLFGQRGYAAVSVAEVASAAGLDLDQVFGLFPRKQNLVFELYHRLALQLEERVVELPRAKLAARFGAVMDHKIASLEPHRATLQGLFETMLDAHQDLGVMSAHMELIRRRVRGVFASLVLGARDRPDETLQPQLVRHLYRIHLGLVLLWFRSPTAYQAARVVVGGLLNVSRPVLDLGPVQSLLGRVDALLQEKAEPYDVETDLARQILGRLFRRRRLQPGHACAEQPCAQCLVLHRGRVEEAIALQQPIELVLPAFPAKSPNRHKVLGDLPDTAEELALGSLHDLCVEIGEIYPPGARLTICSDGHVFSDLVGVSDEQVNAYNQAIREHIERAGLNTLRFFNLADIYQPTDYVHIREQVLPQFSDPVESIRQRVREHAVHRHLFDGLHRFLFEDSLATQPQRSRNQIRKESKELTYRVVQRSNAWGRLVGVHFPQSLRLSIHPQHPHAEKIGLLLSPAVDSWVTPWHGVALLRDQDYLLMKRQQAEEMGAQLCYREGRPVHFTLSARPGAAASAERFAH